MYTVLLILGVLFNVSAQVLLKFGMKNFSFLGTYFDIGKNLILNVYLWISIILYGTGFILYALVLSKFDLSKAYPVSSVLAIILTVFVSIAFMHEPISTTKIIGIFLCLLGVIVIFR